MANNQMPHNLEAESALLGCLLIDEAVQSEILETLKEDDFYDQSHRLILAAMKEIFAARKTVDVVTLTDRLELDGTLDRAGGIQAVTELASASFSSANYKQYLSILKRDSVNRALIRAAQDIIENCRKGPEETDAISYAEKLIYDISRREDGGGLQSLGDGVLTEQVIRKFTEIANDPDAYRGVETGFTHLDRLTNGLQKSDLIVLAARPGMGKTSLAMNIVENACLRKGCVAAVFSLEMPAVQIVQRLMCAHGDVSMERALSAKLVARDWKNLVIASDKLNRSKIYIDDSSRVTPAEILSRCRRLATAEGRLDLVMIDYIQLMSSGKKTSSGDYNRQQEVADITRDLKIMAKELNVPVIALSQLRRMATLTKEPQLSDLRESGAIEQDADIVMFINRPDVTATAEEIARGSVIKGSAELIIAKHRNGAPGRVQLRFIGETTRFIDVEDQNRPDEEPVYHRKREELSDELSPDELPPDDDPPDGEGGIPL